MRLFLALALWFLLLAVCWPLGILLILVFPIIWLITLPFQILGFIATLFFSFIVGIFLLPFKLLGVR